MHAKGLSPKAFENCPTVVDFDWRLFTDVDKGFEYSANRYCGSTLGCSQTPCKLVKNSLEFSADRNKVSFRCGC